MKKKIIAILCAVAMLVNCFSSLGKPMTASAEETGYKELTFSDWGMTNGEFVDQYSYSPKDATITSLDGYALNGMIEVSSGSPNIFIGGKNDGWAGFYMCIQSGQIAFNGSGSGYSCDAGVTLNTIRSKLNDESFNLHNEEFYLRITFDITADKSLALGVYINGVFIQGIECANTGNGQLGAVLMVYLASGSLDMRDVVDGSAKYAEKTFKDFGIYPGTLTADKIGTAQDISTLDEVAISGNVKFGSAGWLIMGHESADRWDWSGIQMYADAEGLNISSALFSKDLKQFAVTNTSGSSASTTDEGYIKIAYDGTSQFCDTDFTAVSASSKIHVFMKNDSESPRYVQMDWTAASQVLDENGNDITVIEAGATKIPANSGWVEVIYPTTQSKQLNCWVGSGNSSGSLLLKGYYVDNGQSYNFTPSITKISNADAGVDFMNDSVNLRLTFDYVSNGLDMGVCVNGSMINRIHFGDSTDGTCNIKEVLGKHIMVTAGFATAGSYKEYSFGEFGIPNGTMTSDTIGTSEEVSSLDGVAISGAVKFENGSWLMLGHESADRGDWSGIQMFVGADGKSLTVAGNLNGYAPLGKLNISSTSGSSYSTTEEGYNKISFDGTGTWCDVNFDTVAANSEIHIFMKNDSEYPRYVQMNWTAANKVLDENGNDITVIEAGATKIPANSGWVEVVYPVTGSSQFNCQSVGSLSVGELLIKGYYVDERKEEKYSFTPSSSQISSDEAGVDFANDFVDMRYTFDYTDQGVNMGVYVSDNFIKTIQFGNSNENSSVNIKDILGSYVMATTGFAYVEELPEEDAASILQSAGYTKLTVPDFGGMGYKTYTQIDGHLKGQYTWASTLDKTYLDMNVTFENITGTGEAYIRYGSSDGWNGFNLATDGTYLYAGLISLGGMFKIYPQSVGMNELERFNVKIALDCGEFRSVTSGDTTYNVADYTVSMWINDRKIISDMYATDEPRVGNTLAIYMGETAGSITLDAEYSEVTRGDVSYNLAKGSYFVSGDATVKKNGETVEVTDCEISMPGDYEVITDVSSNRVKYRQTVTLYKVGDVDLNGTVAEAGDLAKLKEIYTGEEVQATSAAQKGADLDNDGKVDADDLALMEEVCAASNTATALKAVLDKYHVASKSYDFIGGDEVMPIVGFFGPYNNAGYDYLNDKYFQMVKDSGINLVNYSYNGAAGTSEFSSVINTLKLAEKYKIGWFLNDASLSASMTDAEFAQAIGRYGYYDSFLGIHIVDEPVYKESAAYDSGEEVYTSKELSNYTDISAKLNGYSNLTGFINLAPESSTYNCTMKTGFDAWWGNIMGESSIKEDYFDAYFDQYVDESNPSVLSIDDYPFNDDASEGVTNADGYFRSLSMIRGESLDNDIPFWWYVQAGGNFRNIADSDYSYDAGRVATEEETYWNINTALAFGAKGIEWFTLLQDAKFHDESLDSQGIDTNGLIDTDGDKTKFYDWASTINIHIQNVDEVLMKAESTGVITTGGYAASQVKAGADVNKTKDATFNYPIISATNTSRLENVTSNDSTYGALVGCFNYRDMEAYYVVNYNVTAGTSQKVTLTLDGDYNYRVLQQGNDVAYKVGNLCELTIPAGEAVLIVLDTLDESDILCSTEEGFAAVAGAILEGTTINGAKVNETLSEATTLNQWGQYTITYTISSNQYFRELTIYRIGDATYDGVNNSMDLVRMKRASKKLVTLEGMNLVSGDIDSSGEVNEEDAKQLRTLISQED